MNDEVSGRAAQYRYRAQQVRAVAKQMWDTSRREELERVALDYERLADNLERVANGATQH